MLALASIGSRSGLPAALGLPAESTAALLVGLGALAVAVVLLLIQSLRRRRRRSEIREIVDTVDDLRSGAGSHRAQVRDGSPLAPLAGVVNRFADETAAARRERDHAAEGMKALLGVTPDLVILVTDNDGDVRSLSGDSASLFGWDERAILGRPASTLFDEASWREILPKLARREIREAGVESDAVMLGRDGRRVAARVSIRQTRTGAGDPDGFVLVIQDVSNRVDLEARLFEAETRYTRLVEGLREGIVILRETRIVYANSALALMCGVPLEDLPGTLLRDRVATPDVLLLQERLGSLERRSPGEVERMTLTLVGPSGEPRAEVTLTATAILHESGPAVLASLLDETAERRAEEELRRNAARLDAVLEAASDGVVVLARTPAGPLVRLTNRAFVEVSGVARANILGATEADLLATLRASGPHGAAVAAFLSASASVPRRETVTVADAKGRTLELSLFPLTEEKGEGAGKVLACRDVTDQKEFERSLEANNRRLEESRAALEESYRELQEVHDDLARRSQDLDRLNHELKTLDEMKSDLLANVSHELQTPLVSIRGYTEMVLKGRLGAITEEQRRGLTLALNNVDRLIAMIDNLLAFARMDREAAELRLSTFPLAPLVDEAVEVVRAKLLEKRVAIRSQIDEPGLSVRADREKVLQVFLNLLTNAAKFNREGGAIEIVARREKPGFAAIDVRDTGIGIAEDDLEKVFDRFYRVSGEGSAAAPGTGIGLSIVRNILRLHGCVIRVSSQLGRGSTFTFTLPLREESQHPDGDSPPPRAAGVGGEAPRDESPRRVPPPPQPSPGPRFRVIRRPDSDR